MNKEQILKLYEANCATRNYIFTVTRDGMKYALYFENFAFVDRFTHFDKSRNAIRFRPNRKQIVSLFTLADKIVPMMTTEEFEAEQAMPILNAKGKFTKYNRGETAERLVHRMMGIEWEKEHKPFWVCGDIKNENGVEWQIKDESNSTFIDERTAMALR